MADKKKVLNDFRLVEPFDFFGRVGRLPALDLLGPKQPTYVSPEEKEEAAKAVRALWERVRPMTVPAEMFNLKSDDRSEVDVMIVLDSLSMCEDRKKLTVVRSKSRSTVAPPTFKLAYDPHALSHRA